MILVKTFVSESAEVHYDFYQITEGKCLPFLTFKGIDNSNAWVWVVEFLKSFTATLAVKSYGM